MYFSMHSKKLNYSISRIEKFNPKLLKHCNLKMLAERLLENNSEIKVKLNTEFYCKHTVNNFIFCRIKFQGTRSAQKITFSLHFETKLIQHLLMELSSMIN